MRLPEPVQTVSASLACQTLSRAPTPSSCAHALRGRPPVNWRWAVNHAGLHGLRHLAGYIRRPRPLASGGGRLLPFWPSGMRPWAFSGPARDADSSHGPATAAAPTLPPGVGSALAPTHDASAPGVGSVTAPMHEAGATSTPPPAVSFADSLRLPLLHMTLCSQVSRVPDNC
jgi:hypothetical protein